MKLIIKRKNSEGATIIQTICNVEQFTADYSDMDAPSFSEDAIPNLCQTCSEHAYCNLMDIPVYQCEKYKHSDAKGGDCH